MHFDWKHVMLGYSRRIRRVWFFFFVFRSFHIDLKTPCQHYHIDDNIWWNCHIISIRKWLKNPKKKCETEWKKEKKRRIFWQLLFKNGQKFHARYWKSAITKRVSHDANIMRWVYGPFARSRTGQTHNFVFVYDTRNIIRTHNTDTVWDIFRGFSFAKNRNVILCVYICLRISNRIVGICILCIWNAGETELQHRISFHNVIQINLSVIKVDLMLTVTTNNSCPFLSANACIHWLNTTRVEMTKLHENQNELTTTNWILRWKFLTIQSNQTCYFFFHFNLP